MNRHKLDKASTGLNLDRLGPRFKEPTLPLQSLDNQTCRFASVSEYRAARERKRWDRVRRFHILESVLFQVSVASFAIFFAFVMPAYVIFGLPVPVIYFCCQKIRQQILRNAVAKLFDIPSAGNQHATTIRYRYFGIPCGEDTGIVTFVGGLLLFEGTKQSVSLRRQDLVSGLRPSSGAEFTVTTDVADLIPFWIKFDPFINVNARDGHIDAFERDWNNWRDLTETEAGHSTLPPVLRIFGITDIYKRISWTLFATLLLLAFEGFSGRLSQELGGQLWQIATAFLTFNGLFAAIEIACQAHFASRTRSREATIHRLTQKA